MAEPHNFLAAALPQPAADPKNYVDEGASNVELFNEVFKVERQAIFRYIAGLVKDQGITEDLTQDVFKTYLENITTLRRATTRNWLYHIAKNKAIDYTRKNKPVFLGSLEDGSDPLEREMEKAGKVERGVEEYYCDKSLVWEILTRLSDRDRVCLMLKTGYGIKNKEIANIMGIKAKDVSNLHTAALKRARSVWEEMKSFMSDGELEVYIRDTR